MSDISVTVTGLGHSQSVVVDTGASLSDALSAAAVHPDEDGLDVNVNGVEVDPDDYTPENGDQVVTTPKKVALGS